MSKSMSLLFAIIAVCFLIAIGISLSFQQLLLAGLFFLLFFVHLAIGFILKAKWSKANKNENR